ncbi:MAG: hypothetical protein JWO43_333 [Candidatus Adlerbacteria bacterium]|nr:hypothetical protein [Candidatus Adlerbacteria bacterium]
MTTVVTPSTITTGQIGKLQDLLVARLRKSGFSSAAMQVVLETQGDTIGDAMLQVISDEIEALGEVTTEIIVRHVAVDRTRLPQQALNAIGCQQWINPDVVAAMPRGEGSEAEVCFFKPSRYLNDEEVERQYQQRGLRPVDPYSLAAVNEADPTFGDKRENVTHWKDEQGRWCYLAFARSSSVHERSLHVGCGQGPVYNEKGEVSYGSDVWMNDTWFAGIREK